MTNEPQTERRTPVYQILTREAQILADLSGIKLDLELARDYLLAAIPMPTSKIRFGLFQAAHIAYRRACNRGGRSCLTLADIENLGAKEAATHRFHYDQADKLVAHSVNEFEMCKVGVELNDGGRPIAIKTIGAKYAGLAEEDAQEWIELITRLENGPLRQKIEAAGDAIAQWLKTQKGEDLRKGTLITDFEPPPPMSAAGKARPGLSHRRDGD